MISFDVGFSPRTCYVMCHGGGPKKGLESKVKSRRSGGWLIPTRRIFIGLVSCNFTEECHNICG